MNKYFPCPICKGQGGWKEKILEDGSGPYDKCGYCEGKGLIEIGGKRHEEIKNERVAMCAINAFKPRKKDWNYQEILDLGEKIKTLCLK